MSPLLKKNRGVLNDKTTLRNYCFYSALISGGIMILVFLVHKVIPFYPATNTVLRMDLYHQYGPLYSEMYDRIFSGSTLMYSWRSGLGGGFLGNFFNYCCSPSVLILLLVGRKNMPDAIALMFLIKAMLSSATFTYYINKTNKTLNKFSIAFGPLYALCSYYVAYSWNIMWTDAMVVFPLVILGIERIIQEKKPTLFIVGLTYTMITNYYMAYMVCILSVMYFLYYYFSRYEFGSLLKVEANEADTEATEPSDDVIKTELFAEMPEENNSDVTDVIVPNENATDTDIPVVEGEREVLYEDTQMAEDIQNRAAADLLKYAEVVERLENEDDEELEPTAEPKKEKKKKAKKHRLRALSNRRFFAAGFIFAFSAILCFLIAGVALMPISEALTSSSATSSDFPENLKSYFGIFDFLANHLPATETTIRSSGTTVLPNVYCGLITVMLIPLYFFSDRISGRKKIAAVALLAAFYLGFSVNILNYIWHGFHFPNDLPYRYSFAYSFILLTLAYKVLTQVDEFSKKTFTAVGMGIVLFVAVIQKVETPNNKTVSVFLTILFAIVYAIVFGLYYSDRFTKKSITNLFIFTIAIELLFADLTGFVMSQPKKDYTSDFDSYKKIVSVVEKDDKTPFYRTELSKLRTRMDPCWYGYNGVSTFSSMAYESTSGFMKNFGFFGNQINSYTYYPQTPIFNSLFGLKYIYDNSSIVSEGSYYTKKAKEGKFTAYEYKYYLPIGYAVDDDIAEWNYTSKNPFDVQNSVFGKMTGVHKALIPVKATNVSCSDVNNIELSSVNSGASFTAKKDNKDKIGRVTVTVKVDKTGYYYTYSGSTKIDSMKITTDNGYKFEYSSSGGFQPYILDVGYVKENGVIEISYTVTKDTNSATIYFGAARLDEEAFNKAYGKLKNQSLNITSFSETEIVGTIKTTSQAPTVFTSIPYDRSWEVTVDGKKLDYAKITKPESGKKSIDNGYTIENTEGKVFKSFNSFMAFNVGEGEHIIKLKYVPAGLSTGVKMTAIGIAIAVVLLLYKLVISKKLEERN